MRWIALTCLIGCTAILLDAPCQQAAILSGATREVDGEASDTLSADTAGQDRSEAAAIWHALTKALIGKHKDDSDVVKAVRNGDYDTAIVMLRRKIEQNPGDAGKDYNLRPRRPLTARAVEHGRQQLLRMLQDRPSMWGHVESNLPDPLSRWTIRKFAGEDTGCTIDWDPAPPKSAFMAEHTVPTDERRGAIRIATVHAIGPERGQQLTSEELWSSAVFELHNISTAEGFLRLSRQASIGELSRSKYIDEIYLLEYEAVELSRGFYCYVYLPWAREKRLPSDPRIWYVTTWDPMQLMHPEVFRIYREYCGRGYDNLQLSMDRHREKEMKECEGPPAPNGGRAPRAPTDPDVRD